MGHQVRFDRFRFDTDTRRLWADKEEVHLTPKAAAVMGMLVAHGGEPVTKQSLFTSVWPDATVSDDALTTCIVELRRALGDDARQPHFIETRHRRGYRFVASLTPEDVAPTAPSRAPRTSMRLPPSTPRIATIAVLPFADMSPRRDHEYLCEGLAEELINALTQVEGLRVAARTASFRFRDLRTDVQSMGRQLGVSALLEGSVRKAKDRLRVNVQLIEVATGFHRWSQPFDRAYDDVFAIQDEIAECVVQSLRRDVLSRPEQDAARRRPAKTEAYAGPAMAHAALHEWFGADDAGGVAAEQVSERALQLAPAPADAHVARGWALALFEACYYYARLSLEAEALFDDGQPDRAQEWCDRSLTLRALDLLEKALSGRAR